MSELINERNLAFRNSFVDQCHRVANVLCSLAKLLIGIRQLEDTSLTVLIAGS